MNLLQNGYKGEPKLGLPQKCAIALLIFAGNLAGTADALPGQAIKHELQWAQNHPILPKLTYECLYLLAICCR